MRGYWGRPEATRLAIDPDGWLHTGDAARRDDEGFISIVGRLSDALVLSGRTIHPGEIERIVEARDDVAEAAAFATGAGELVLAVVPATANVRVDDLRAAVGAAAAPVPSQIRIVRELPRSSVGKLLRDRLGEVDPVEASGPRSPRG
jgi:acyl-CoA synthetase (AMP-forming)/AMP-acid ligase II